MTRSTDTRAKVRELADKIAAAGGVPTPSSIRNQLGKGSPNTIVGELKAWNRARQAGGLAVAGDSARATENGGREPAEPPQLQGLTTQVQELTRLLATLTQKKEPFSAESSAGVDPTVAGLKAIEARFEGVQKYMLLQINEAREESVRWRQKYQQAKDEHGQWQTAIRQKLDALSAENAWLRGRIGEPNRTPVAARTEVPIVPAAKAMTYSGFPRAAFSEDE